MNTPVSLAVLDMAGTTVSDDGVVEDAFLRALAEHGWSADRLAQEGRARVVDAMGRAKLEVFTELLDGDVHAAVSAEAAFRRHYDEAVAGGAVAPIPGAAEAVGRLRDNGIAVCLTTGFAPETRDGILDALGWQEIADLVLSPADAGRGRPYPDMVLTAVLRLRIDEVAAVAVAGDTVHDLESGRRAGASVLAGVLTGAHDRQRLLASPHTHLLSSVADLPDVLLG